jgi:hypothetical protein
MLVAQYLAVHLTPHFFVSIYDVSLPFFAWEFLFKVQTEQANQLANRAAEAKKCGDMETGTCHIHKSLWRTLETQARCDVPISNDSSCLYVSLFRLQKWNDFHYVLALDYHSQAARKYNEISLRVRSRNGKYKSPQVVEKTCLSYFLSTK